MKTTRREFMRAVGVAIASLLTSRCTRPTCYVLVITAPPKEDALWDALRAPWTNLDRLARDAQDMEKGQATLQRLIADHQAALDQLVAAGALSSDIADDLQAAFAGAAHHVWRANAPITCYIPSPYPDYRVQSSSDLARQAEILEEMAQKSSIDPQTVAQVQAAIERDITYLAMAPEDQQALVEAVIKTAGEGGPYPSLTELDLDLSHESVEAAHILVELLLGEK